MKTLVRVPTAVTLRASMIAPWRILFVLVTFAMAPISAFAQTPVPPVANPCPRLTAGSAVQQPPALYSEDGVLNASFSYQQTTDSVGRLLHCFMTPDGLEEPTLHVNPGDTLNITVTNNTLNNRSENLSILPIAATRVSSTLLPLPA